MRISYINKKLNKAEEKNFFLIKENHIKISTKQIQKLEGE
jgi:hypothetical protein